MNTWSFYESANGRFTGRSYCGPEAYLVANTPAGCSPMAGLFDPLQVVVDIETGAVAEWVPPMPADTADFTHAWDQNARRWVATPTLTKVEADAHTQIDAAAGAARLRFITDVAGQQAVYMLKLVEAQALIASPDAVAPHLVSEAQATGKMPLEIAQSVVARAGLWNSVVSPWIEGARIGGKVAVTAAMQAGDREALHAAAVAAITTLQAIGPPA